VLNERIAHASAPGCAMFSVEFSKFLSGPVSVEDFVVTIFMFLADSLASCFFAFLAFAASPVNSLVFTARVFIAAY
jgi:hypothetical protein